LAATQISDCYTAGIKSMFLRSYSPLLLYTIFISTAPALDLDPPALESALHRMADGFDGRIGVCAQTRARSASVRGDDRFSLQSVMKLVAGVATLDTIDKGQRRLEDVVIVRRQDLSLYVQPLANLVGPSGYRTTVGDLVRRAIIDSDSAAVDIQVAQLGGPAAVQAILNAKGISGIRVDRDERHLQTEIAGLEWRPEYVDPAVLKRAIDAVPKQRRQEAYAKYRRDPRDTATPAGMASFLLRLAQGDLLSKASAGFALQAMTECKTFPDRLQAGLAPGWHLAHKTGTSGSWEGLTVATNDVGILTAPDGSQISIAVFVADSRRSAADRNAIIAKICAAVIAHYR
jgi:beta-lactamase class A